MNSPHNIFIKFQEGNLSKKLACEFFYNLIQNSKSEMERLESLQLLEKLEFNKNKMYKLLENLLVSESSNSIRNHVIQLLNKKFLKKSNSLFAWKVKHERDLICYVNILKSLSALNTEKSKEIIIEELNKIRNLNYVDKRKLYPTKSFQKSLQNLLKGRKIQELPINRIKEIIINFKTISEILDKYLDVFFSWDKGKIIHLDLSEIGWSILRSWRQSYSDRITDTSEIPGLTFLKDLDTLDLSSNRIKSIKNLKDLKNLTTLIIANNKLEDPINIEYLKSLKALKYLDMRGNKIANLINEDDFPDVKLITKTSLLFL